MLDKLQVAAATTHRRHLHRAAAMATLTQGWQRHNAVAATTSTRAVVATSTATNGDNVHKRLRQRRHRHRLILIDVNGVFELFTYMNACIG